MNLYFTTWTLTETVLGWRVYSRAGDIDRMFPTAEEAWTVLLSELCVERDYLHLKNNR